MALDQLGNTTPTIKQKTRTWKQGSSEILQESYVGESTALESKYEELKLTADELSLSTGKGASLIAKYGTSASTGTLQGGDEEDQVDERYPGLDRPRPRGRKGLRRPAPQRGSTTDVEGLQSAPSLVPEAGCPRTGSSRGPSGEG